MDDNIYLIIVAGIVILLIVVKLFSGKNDKWVSTDDFREAKKKLRPYCSESDYNEFMKFLNSYKGGYVKRKSGEIVYRAYLGQEKGDLKGIFYNVIVPNPNLSISEKETFRKFIQSVGVNGVDNRPSYETRDSRLKNRETDEDAYQRKEVGNKGEQAVRIVLDGLNQGVFAVINGPILKKSGITKEYDHIVVGENGIFIIETKAFGMSDGQSGRASLFIDKGDKWIIRKNGKNRDLISPTEQILEERNLIEDIISCPVEVHSVLVLSNSELFVKQNMDLPYDVIRIDKLKEYILSHNDRIQAGNKYQILQNIDKCRIN